MKQLMLNPTIYKYDDCRTFCREFRIGKDDLIITNKKLYNNYLKYNVNEAAVLFKDNYGNGEPSDEMIEAMHENVKRVSYERVIAIGGGSVLDIGKLFALGGILPIEELYQHKLEIIKEKELVLVPTTCGTGSEVTNISSLELKAKKVKIDLSTDELYADSAIIIPELLQSLPFEVFVTSSIGAFIQAFESYLSPRATTHTRIFSLKAIEIILKGYKKIVKEGREARYEILEDFLLASNYSGIAFGNAGCAEVYEMSHSLSSVCNVPYSEATYIIFTKMFKVYQKIDQNKDIRELNRFLAGVLECAEDIVYDEIENLLDSLITKKSLSQYGMDEQKLEKLVRSFVENKGEASVNNY
ncbi:iron-containing alcohol dehydrogenase [Clostridium sp.]|uniref:iron-containing alcohol dehydrogenase n=1 Tax=Clostridium sp. TaxID=1506 RepID=UPI00284F5AC4|nr:iron-containing alcohol dehydrogenase [Clostridium sp.]MDR3596161.1 iron-containing alcohol dehydrogenase [Clostridium sp.]